MKTSAHGELGHHAVAVSKRQCIGHQLWVNRISSGKELHSRYLVETWFVSGRGLQPCRKLAEVSYTPPCARACTHLFECSYRECSRHDGCSYHDEFKVL